MSFIYNAAQDPSALAYQNSRNSILSNPALSVGNGQMSLGAYGTIGGVPIDMLGLPNTASNDPNSMLQQFDQQNGGLFALGAQLAGPDSMVAQLNQKYTQAQAMENAKAQYAQAMQIQQMQMQMMMQQQALAQATAGASQGATSAATSSSDNSASMLALVMLLMTNESKNTDETEETDTTQTADEAPESDESADPVNETEAPAE